MASRRRHEQIILKLRHAEQLIADGATTADAAKAIEVSELNRTGTAKMLSAARWV